MSDSKQTTPEEPEGKAASTTDADEVRPSEEKGKGFASTTVGILGFVLALGGGFYLGKWIRKPEAPPVDLVQGERYKVSLRGDEPTKGADDALVTIVEFADFQCPYCAKAAEPLEEILDDHSDDVRLVYKHYPLRFHRKAPMAARAAWAAHRQGKFWEMHDWLYKTEADVTGIKEQVEALGMDWEQFSRDSVSQEASDDIDDDFFAGGLVGITGTPAFVVNGHPYKGLKREGQWRQIIDSELEVARQLIEAGTARADVYAKLMEDAKESRQQTRRAGKPPSERQAPSGPGTTAEGD
jgi:protein-disulfide isomerase